MTEFSNGPATFDAMVSRQLEEVSEYLDFWDGFDDPLISLSDAKDIVKAEDLAVKLLSDQVDEYKKCLLSIRQIVNSGATGRGALLMEKDKIAELINALNL